MTDAQKTEVRHAVAAALGNPDYRPTFLNPNTQQPNHCANAFDAAARLMGLPNRAWRGSVPKRTAKYEALLARNMANGGGAP